MCVGGMHILRESALGADGLRAPPFPPDLPRQGAPLCCPVFCCGSRGGEAMSLRSKFVVHGGPTAWSYLPREEAWPRSLTANKIVNHPSPDLVCVCVCVCARACVFLAARLSSGRA